MNIGIVTRKNESQFGGDLVALKSIGEGFNELGFRVFYGPTSEAVIKSDFIFLSNSCTDLRREASYLSSRNKRWGIIGFHEDFSKYYGDSIGFATYVQLMVDNQDIEGEYATLSKLLSSPKIYTFLNQKIPPTAFLNYNVLKDAKVCVANSNTEKGTMLKDCPSANVIVAPLAPGITEGDVAYSDEFLRLTGLDKGSYVLQIGRLEIRKNQLASILAMRDIDKPLVFIATKGYQSFYDNIVFKTIKKYRKYPTYIISEEHASYTEGNLKIIQMPNGQRLSNSCILSAYQNAGLHLHPAFWETPGYTYLEASRLGIPSVASSWGGFKDYCTLEGNSEDLNGLIKYVSPYDITGIESAIRELFGLKFEPIQHPIFTRTGKDMASEILQHIQ